MVEIFDVKLFKSDLKIFWVIRIGSSFEEFFINVIINLDNVLLVFLFWYRLYFLLDLYYMERSY